MQCDHTVGSTPACYALFSQNEDGRLNVIVKGCITQGAQDCAPSSVCTGKRGKTVRDSPALYHCCCTEDRCNRDVIIFVSEETEKNCVIEGKNLILNRLTCEINLSLFSNVTQTSRDLLGRFC